MVFLWFSLLLSAATPTLLGRVFDNATGKPIARAEVRITLADGQVLTPSVNDRGSFRIGIIGRFRLGVRHEGYRSIQSSEITLPSEGLYQIDIGLDSGNPGNVEPVELQLQELQDIEDRTDPTAREGLPKSDRLFGLRGGVNVYGIREGSGQQWVATTGNVFTSSSSSTTAATRSDFSANLGDTSAEDDALPAGENVFHGNLHYFNRNDLFNARNFFDLPDSPIPPFKYNFFGGDTGGRVGRDTYVYTQYWGLRIRQSITRAATVPNPQWLTGDFSDISEALLDPETGFTFEGNQIPADRLDPTGYALAKLYPAPNVSDGSTQNYRAVAKLNTEADAFGLRVDRRLTVADEAFIEYQFNRDTTDDPFNLISGITNLPFYGVRDALQTHSLRLNNTHVFSPALIHELRLSFAYVRQPRTIQSSSALPAVLINSISNLGHAPNLPQERLNRSFGVLNDFEWQRKGSAVKFGAEVRYFPFHASMDLFRRGQFQFTGGIFSGQPFANLLLGFPTNALRIRGDTSRDFRTSTSSFYFQREWRMFPRLNVSAGLRYDYQTPVREAQDRVANFDASTGTMVTSPKRLYETDRNNWAPRLGLAWQTPLKDVVARAGYGIFYDTLSVGDSLFLLGLNPPNVQFDLENNGPVVPLFSIDDAFSKPLEAIHPSVFSTARQLPNPYVQQWTVSVERPLPWNMAGTVEYSGQKGTRLRRQVNLNQPAAGSAGGIDDRRPYPDFLNIFQFETSASSIAHSAELRVSRPFRGRYSFEADYRFSRQIDDATLISVLPQDSHNLRAERGLADFQMKHRLSFQAVANLPDAGWFRGWQIHGVGVAQSGTPLSAVLNADVAGTGYPIVNRPDLVHDPNISHPSADRFFDTTAFRTPDPGFFGNSGRNVIIGPGLWNLDVALSRAFHLSDFTRLQFRADAYNVTNHPNFVAPPSMQNFADTPEFGKLFVARSPRIVQFGLKFLW
jgi:TonB dependent receptor-like, beta-barrel/Carboxypeptidase regulatory-like domain